MLTKEVFFSKMLWKGRSICLYQGNDETNTVINFMFRDQFPPQLLPDIKYVIEGYFHRNQFEVVGWSREKIPS